MQRWRAALLGAGWAGLGSDPGVQREVREDLEERGVPGDELRRGEDRFRTTRLPLTRRTGLDNGAAE